MNNGFIPLIIGLVMAIVAVISSNHSFLNGLFLGLLDFPSDMSEIRRRRAPITYWSAVIARTLTGLVGLMLVVIGITILVE